MGRRRRFYGHRVRRSVRVRYRRNTYIVGGGPTYHRRGIGVGPGFGIGLALVIVAIVIIVILVILYKRRQRHNRADDYKIVSSDSQPVAMIGGELQPQPYAPSPAYPPMGGGGMYPPPSYPQPAYNPYGYGYGGGASGSNALNMY